MSPVQLKKPMETYFLRSQQHLISEEIQEMLKKVALHKMTQKQSRDLGFLSNLVLVKK